MTSPDPHERRVAGHAEARDRGSVLLMVLVFLVIGSLMVLPLLSYSMSVMRANSVLSNKTQRVEAVKGGLRASLADPEDLYRTCGLDNVLSSVTINGSTVKNECEFLYAATALAETEIRYGIVTTQVGEAAPPFLAGARYESSDPASATAWLADTTVDSVTGKVMLPNLPVYGTSPRSPLGSQMPAEYILNGYDSCTVYFPGRYTDPIVLDGPTYFVDGIYYFTQSVTVLGGADVVVGSSDEACTQADWALFYSTPEPSGTHNITGTGATWVLGNAGRVVFDNNVTRTGAANSKPIKFLFNQRYVHHEDLATRPSADVSIVTVNGDPARTPDIAGEGHYLEVYDPADPARAILHVPEQFVGSVADDPTTVGVNESDTVRDTGVPALSNGYVASVLTPQPRQPSTPTNVAVSARQQHLVVSWDPPANDGNSPVVAYLARAWSSGAEVGACATTGSTRCVIGGLNTSLAHTVTVEAINQWMTEQDPMPEPTRWTTTQTWTPGGGSTPSLTAPPAANRPTVTMWRVNPVTTPRTAGIAHVEFTVPTPTASSTPIVGYDVERRQTHTLDGVAMAETAGVAWQWTSCNGDTPTPDIEATARTLDTATLYCDFSGLDPTAAYAFRVVARATPTSTLATSGASASPLATFAGTPANTISPTSGTHAALDTTDPASPHFGKLATYVTTSWSAGHAAHVPEPADPPAAALPPAVVEFNLGNTDAGATASINIASYIAVPQGRFVLDNPRGFDVRVGGGVLAASLWVDDHRSTCPSGSPSDCVADAPDIVPVGLRPVEVQRKFKITSWIDGHRERSVAVVQVNRNGAYAVNSWEVQ